MRSEQDSPNVTAKNGEDSWLVIARKGEDSGHVIASPEGAKQSLIERMRLPRRLAPRNDFVGLPRVARNGGLPRRYAPRNDNIRMRRPTDDKSSQRGFTLVELLVSFALVFILITGTAQLTIHSLLLKRRADCNLRTAELASSKFEYLKSLSWESDELKEGFQMESVRGEGLLEIFWREWRIQDISSNMKKVEIEIFSKTYPRKKLRMVLFISKDLGF